MTGTNRLLFWGALGAGALALRLVGLGSSPLSSSEAVTAWPALVAALPEGGLPGPVPGSALLATLQWIAFGMLGAGDVLARVPGALLGAALAVLPACLERTWGQAPARSLGLLLVLDPTLLGIARSAEGFGVGVFLAALLLTLLLQEDTRLHRLAAPVAGLLLVSGFEAWSLLPIVAIAALVAGRWRAPTRRDQALVAAFALLGATGLLVVPEFAGAVSASLTAWLHAWDAPSAWPRVSALLRTDLPVVVLAAAGALWTSPGRGRRGAATLVAATWALVAPVSRREPEPALLALALLPSAAVGLAWLYERATTGRATVQRLALGAGAVVTVGLVLRAVSVSQVAVGNRGLARLAADVATLSAQRTPDRQEIPVVVPERADPALLWALRRIATTTVARLPADAAARPFVIASREPVLEGYFGHAYGAEPGSVVLWVPR